MCDELGSEEYMQAYVEEMGNTSLCQVGNPVGCDEREKEFIEKWKSEGSEQVLAQITRLETMSDKKMKPSLKEWVDKRIKILRQIKEKKKKYRLRGRSSETAKAHRG
eukprot:TRINITY_DN1520_c0_g1_i2.p2 TRINITY_DN1520_c0_g1~~TRINITY_DN1520_c0_g1_i2.p2  ORF type:complete len:107 (+),score=44.25 TRINITY_DN1520_c0_g1_i2:285-605(+)